jgi:hypothetical protein
VLVHKEEDLVDSACFNKFGNEEGNVLAPKVSITASYFAGPMTNNKTLTRLAG